MPNNRPNHISWEVTIGMKRTIRTFAALLAVCAAAVLGAVFYLEDSIPDRYLLVPGQELSFHTLVPVYARASVGNHVPEVYASAGNSYQLELTTLGGIKVKNVQVNVVDRPMVIPGGQPFGIKMFTDGVIVVGLSDIPTGSGRVNPAKEAGITTGDILLSIDGEKATGNRQVAQQIADSQGEVMAFRVRRGNEVLDFTVRPALSQSDGQYHAGIWVRDSSAGIGTVTWYDPASGLFTGLGHPVCDVDTGELMPLNRGEAVEVTVTGVSKGQSGTPGELKGCFLEERILGRLTANTNTGIYGQLSGGWVQPDSQAMPVATKQEVHTGAATILTTLEGETPREYTVEIEKVDLSGSDTKNLVVKVTDPELIAQTGGIVQGMSGSPILQDGMVVGSVTHVFVNDPLRGFGIFAENILTGAQATYYSTGLAS